MLHAACNLPTSEAYQENLVINMSGANSENRMVVNTRKRSKPQVNNEHPKTSSEHSQEQAFDE
jgi:hypothetical protein